MTNMHTVKSFCAAAALAALLVASPVSSQDAVERSVLIGLVNNNEPGFRAEVLTPTLDYLKKTLPNISFRTVDIAAYKAVDDLFRTRPDFVIAPSDVFVTLSSSISAHPLAVRKSSFAKDANRSLGSAVIALKTRADINHIADLKGKTISASLPDSLGGWLAFAGELAAQGHEADSFFSRIDFETYQIPEVVGSVLSGRSDAGVLSTCQLEVAEQRGLIEAGKLKVLNARRTPGFSCSHSTHLYPDQIFGSVNENLDPETLKQISIALLQMREKINGSGITEKDNTSFSWQVVGRFDSINRLFKALKIGPYAYLKDWSFEGILKRFSSEITIVLCLLTFLTLSELRLYRLVKIRTAKLNDLVEEKGRMLEEVRGLNHRLHNMERYALVSQMSSVIAHDLKQPLGAIINYCAVLQMAIESGAKDESKLADVTDAVNREAHRIAQIVDRVRSYVKRPNSQHKLCKVGDLVKRAVDSFAHYADSTPKISVMLSDPDARINAEALEIEILFLNLLKNAGRAVRKNNGNIEVRTHTDDKCVYVSVADSGPALTDEQFKQLSDVCDSTTAEGLGLGLAIVRSIADAHSAHIQIDRLIPCGVKFTVIFEKF